MSDYLLGGELHARLAEREHEAGHGDSSLSRSLIDVFATTVARCRERTALDAPESRLTYAELWDSVRDLAAKLRKLGIGPGDRVGVYVSSGTADLYVAILATLHAGAAYVPVDADDPPARAQSIWESAGACAVIEEGLRITQLGEPLGAGRQLTAEDDAWVIFTSGSTGKPKGVAVSHRAAVAFIDAESELWTVDPDDRVLAGLSVGFDASCEEIWLAWAHGAALVPAPRSLVRAGAELGPWLAERKVSIVSTVPTLAAMWDEEDISGVRLLILGGERCPEALAWRLAEGREAWNTYGPTEATVVSTGTRLRPGEPVTIGWPLRGWEVAIVDERGEPVALGESGELAIGGVGLGRYLDPALDAERYAPLPALDWPRAYRTGDIVRETIDGLRFLGRRDDQIKLGGRRLELGELDAALAGAPGVRAGAAAVRHTPAGNPVLVGYVVGDIDPELVKAEVSERLPRGIVPLIVALDGLPTSASGKIDRQALPWPPPVCDAPASELGATEAWLAERWADQLGQMPVAAHSDFFELGGSSLAVAKLVSALRDRFPSVAVADVYRHRRLGELAGRLDQLRSIDGAGPLERSPARRSWALLQLLGVMMLKIAAAPQWILAALAVNRLDHGQTGPQLAWGWLIAGWLVFASVPGRAVLLLLARKLLLGGLRPGRYPRHSWLMFRIWFVEQLTAAWRLEGLAGTPWAARYARLCGHRVGSGARLFTLPPVASLVTIGDDATVEADVDIEGWWLDGDDLVIAELRIGDRARLGTHSVLMPGAEIEAGAEIEPGSVVTCKVAPGRRWAGSPAREVGPAGERWPSGPAPRPERPRLWRVMYGVGIAANTLLPLAAAAPGALLLVLIDAHHFTSGQVAGEAIIMAPLLATSFIVSYAVLVALLVRAVAPLIRPGWHPEEGGTRWALWVTESLLGNANGVLFPLYLSVYTRSWLRLIGIRVGKRAEVSISSGLNRLTRLGDTVFVADAVEFAAARSRVGWLHVAPITVGSGSFLGNGSIVRGATEVGEGCLLGVLSTAPDEVPDGTSWFGSPALKLPKRTDRGDPARTTDPPRRLILARGATELVRIVLPASVSVILGSVVFDGLEHLGARDGTLTMIAAVPFVLLAAGVCAAAITIALKWLLIGRYRPGQHPLWSFFVWRDEIMNTCQEQVAGTWLMRSAQATPLMSLYLRLMGAKVGRDVWCETMTITEFDMVELADGSVVNRHALVETHLFHDRLLRIGPARLGAGATLGPISAMLPDTSVGEGASVGARSVVMRGEQLPPRTRWHGAPVESVDCAGA
jgi:non-ribosomal peptide synthetase-like protein